MSMATTRSSRPDTVRASMCVRPERTSAPARSHWLPAPASARRKPGCWPRWGWPGCGSGGDHGWLTFSTGDELRAIGQPLGEGQIYDSNRYTLGAMISRLNLEPVDMGVVGDNREQLEEAFAEAAGADAIITSGGVSVGAADFVTETLERMGSVGFWKVAMKPGKPIAFGRIRNALFFGLPGNPVSVMATFYQLVRPALERLRGIEHPPPPILLPAVCTDRLRKRPGRVEFQRGVLERGNDGRYTVRGVDHQGAGVLSSMAVANCFIVLAAEREDVAAGSEVAVQPFSGLI